MCYVGQVEEEHAGVSLPGCLWPHIAGDSGGMSLHSLRWNQHSGYRAVVIALIQVATGSCMSRQGCTELYRQPRQSVGVPGDKFADSRFLKSCPLGEKTGGSPVTATGQERGHRSWGQGNTASRGAS